MSENKNNWNDNKAAAIAIACICGVIAVGIIATAVADILKNGC